MSRWIDADVLMQKLDIKSDCKECNSIDHFFGCLRSCDFVNACEAINDAPSIDIVRCGECKAYDSECEWCKGLGLEMKADDFCSYGEREGE